MYAGLKWEAHKADLPVMDLRNVRHWEQSRSQMERAVKLVAMHGSATPESWAEMQSYLLVLIFSPTLLS